MFGSTRTHWNDSRCWEGLRLAPLPFFLFPGYRSGVTGVGLTDIMRLNNLSGYVNDLIPRKRLSVQHILQNDAHVCIANEIQRKG